jgi:hypothetical protein
VMFCQLSMDVYDLTHCVYQSERASMALLDMSINHASITSLNHHYCS